MLTVKFKTKIKEGVSILICCFAFYSSACVAQTLATSPTHAYWISPGLGKADFPSGMLAIGFEPANSHSVITARFSLSAELFQQVEPGIKTKELGLMYGLKVGHFRFSAGLSSVWGNYRGRYLYTDPDPLWGSGQVYEFVSYRVVGVPAEIRYMATLKHVGIGLTAFGNLNDKRTFVGLNLSLYFGKLK